MKLQSLHEWMSDKFVDVCSVWWFDLETTVQEVFQLVGDIGRVVWTLVTVRNLHKKSEIVLIEPRRLPSNHLEHSTTKTPNVWETTRCGHLSLSDQFRSSPVGITGAELWLLWARRLRNVSDSPEICEFALAILVYEDAGCLDITMDNLVLMKEFKAVKDALSELGNDDFGRF